MMIIIKQQFNFEDSNLIIIIIIIIIIRTKVSLLTHK